MELVDHLAPLRGLVCHGVRLKVVPGQGELLTFRLGATLQSPAWRVHVHTVAWRVEAGSSLVVGSGDDPGSWVERAQVLHRRELTAVTVDWPSMATTFTFGEVRLCLYPVNAVVTPAAWGEWIMFTPDGELVTIGPGSTWNVGWPDRQS